MAVLALLGWALVTACQPVSGVPSPSGSATSGEAPSGTTGGTTSAPKVSIVRTGGIAGVRQQLTVAPDGSWVYTDRRTDKVERGRLTEAQRLQLARIAADPALAQEARRSDPPGPCADMFVYAMTIGDYSYGYAPCGVGTRRPLTEQVLNLLSDATPL